LGSWWSEAFDRLFAVNAETPFFVTQFGLANVTAAVLSTSRPVTRPVTLIRA